MFSEQGQRKNKQMFVVKKTQNEDRGHLLF